MTKESIISLLDLMLVTLRFAFPLPVESRVVPLITPIKQLWLHNSQLFSCCNKQLHHRTHDACVAFPFLTSRQVLFCEDLLVGVLRERSEEDLRYGVVVVYFVRHHTNTQIKSRGVE